jgi:hypothetical protein
MRMLFLLLAAACWWTFQTYHAPDAWDADPLPPVSSAADPTAPAPEPEGFERLWAVATADAEPAHDPVVLCRVSGEADYLRLSICRDRGGLADDEPSWARID